MSTREVAGEKGQFLIYQAEDGKLKLEVRLEDETLWLTQGMLSDLFQTSVPNISMHIHNVYAEGELRETGTLKKFLTVRREGSRDVERNLDYYNLDVAISVGYRVKSNVATRFRMWATERLKEYVIKGFTLDDERLKNPDQPFDYFEELSRRIQDIRTSERRFYQKITDIYATSIDYDPTQDVSIEFFKTVQNKMHWAITGKTAAEVIHSRADSKKPNMGLTSFRGAKIRKRDVSTAKNYLTINDREILLNAGKISHDLAKEVAEREYDRFHFLRILKSTNDSNDFDKAVKSIESAVKKTPQVN